MVNEASGGVTCRGLRASAHNDSSNTLFVLSPVLVDTKAGDRSIPVHIVSILIFPPS